MTAGSPVARGTVIAAVTALAFGFAAPAQAQGKLTASYSISVARIPVGKAALTVDVGDDAYTATGSGEASGVASIAVSGKGTVAVRGIVSDGKLAATSFTADLTRGDETSDMTMALDHGTVTEIKAEKLAPGDDRIAITEAHRHGIVDPLSAWLIPAGDRLGQASCERTLPVFDGQRRYDIKLTFKRMDQVKIDEGYQGPAAVCALTFQPIAGHRASSSLVKYLAQGRDIELWLAPVGGTPVLAPVKVTIASMLGNLVVQASKFQTQRAAKQAELGADATNK